MTSTSLSPVAESVAAELARADRRRARLDELLAVGMDLLRDLTRRSAEGETLLERIAAQFARVSRAVRMVLAIAAWLDDQVVALLRGETPAPFWVDRRPRAARADALVAETAEDEPAGDASDDPADASEPPEAREAPGRAAAAPPTERFAFASWNEAINAICNAFGIVDRSRFLECDEDEARLRPAPPSHDPATRLVAQPAPPDPAGLPDVPAVGMSAPRRVLAPRDERALE